MQGHKKFTPKLFLNFCLPDQIPDDNFYKVLKEQLDLSFIYKSTKDLYSHTGKPSIDPVVFFKCLLIGYLENLCLDRALERCIKLRLDLLYFIDHDIGESPPDHSTICKIRKRIPTEIFEEVFNHILKLCVKSGLVKGSIQSIDTAYINANASLDKMVECPARIGCVGKRGFKKIEHTIYRKEYDEMIKRLKSEAGKESYALRMQTVEPVFGTLQQHYGLRWINARGKTNAHKIMLMAACALNLKKFVKNKLEKGLFYLFLAPSALWNVRLRKC